MDVCLLCLEGKKEIDECIKVNSDRWNQQNINKLIEKHLWPMDIINSLSWMCIKCGEELYDFHKFYKRIEEAHKNFATVFKCEKELSIADENDFNDSESIKSKEDCKYNIFEENALEENNVMETTLINETVLDDPFIKIEKEEELNIENGHLSTKRKRGRPTKISRNKVEKDPLKKKIRHSKRSKQKVHKVKDLNEYIIQKGSESKEDIVKQELGTKNNIDDFDTDPEDQKQENESEACVLKKKNHRNLDANTLQEYDKIISENFKIFCSVCQTALDNFLSLRKHFKVEHKTRGYARCCKRNFYTRSVLVDHIHVHLNPEHFKCHQCGKVFSDRSRLQCHKKLHDYDSILDKCEKCGKLFADKGSFKKHILTHSSEKSYPCNICGRYFTNNFILNHHIEAVHENKYVQICEVCGKSIRCPTAFAGHMAKHEVNAVPISCDICGLLLSNKEGLKRHKNSQHPEGGKREHACHICLKVSPTERALKAHVRSVHELGPDLKCNFCEKAFKRPGALKEHVATHTRTALYTCPWCPRTFISNGNMYNHRKNAHPKEWEELKRQRYVKDKMQ